MLIAVNARLLLKDRLEGIGWFACETLKRIAQQHREHRFLFIFDRPFSEEFIFSDNVIPVVSGPQARHPFLFWLWFEFSVPPILGKYKADLFFSPDGYLSLSTPVPSLPVIHDLNFEHYPGGLPFLVRNYYRRYFPRFAKKAARIATVSEFTKQDIVKQYGIAEKNIDVVYNGVNEIFTPVEEPLKEQTRKKYSQGQPYFLFVGALHPRKNIANLFRAFDRFKESSPSPLKLLVAGQKKWWTSELSSAYDHMKFKQEVVFTGRLTAEELHKVTASAFAAAYVSAFEGFGIPLLEAMQCDVPCITSSVTSMPEVCGDAALYANPFSIESIAGAMEKIWKEASLREELIRKGQTRRQNFSWQKTADCVWESILKAIPGSK
jgi:glycosyltransferase involved in cell wall biosynthesis